MQRKQWFAAGMVALLFLALNMYKISQSYGEGGPSPTGDEFVLWVVPTVSAWSQIEIFGMVALICFVCGFLEKKEEKK
jgi:hypothetical protein